MPTSQSLGWLCYTEVSTNMGTPKSSIPASSAIVEIFALISKTWFSWISAILWIFEFYGSCSILITAAAPGPPSDLMIAEKCALPAFSNQPSQGFFPPTFARYFCLPVGGQWFPTAVALEGLLSHVGWFPTVQFNHVQSAYISSFSVWIDGCLKFLRVYLLFHVTTFGHSLPAQAAAATALTTFGPWSEDGWQWVPPCVAQDVGKR